MATLISDHDNGVSRTRMTNGQIPLGSDETLTEFQLLLQASDLLIPKVDLTVPLPLECQRFFDCILSNERLLNDGESGLRVIRVLKAGNASRVGAGAAHNGDPEHAERG